MNAILVTCADEAYQADEGDLDRAVGQLECCVLPDPPHESYRPAYLLHQLADLLPAQEAKMFHVHRMVVAQSKQQG